MMILLCAVAFPSLLYSCNEALDDEIRSSITQNSTRLPTLIIKILKLLLTRKRAFIFYIHFSDRTIAPKNIVRDNDEIAKR